MIVKKFNENKSVNMRFRPFIIRGKDIEMVECFFRISLIGYKDIYNDLEQKKDAKKYNL